MLTYADVFSRMLKYADICGRVLTYGLSLLLQLLQPADIALLPSGFKTLGEWVPNLLALLVQKYKY